MSQHDFNIANQSFPATRTDLNNALAALASNSSGDTEPGTTYANQWWYETDTNILKIRNEANNGWVDVITLDASMTASASELNQLDAITRGSILYGNASGATARLAKGAAGTVLTSDGTDISWAAAAGGGAMEFISSSGVVSNVANISFTGFDATKYDNYQFWFQNIIPATDEAKLYARTSSDGGSSYDSGASDYRNYNDNRDHMMITNSGVGAGTNEVGISGNLNIFNPHLTTYTWLSPIGLSYADAYGAVFCLAIIGGDPYGGLQRLSNDDVDGVRFYFSSGNITSGEIVMYGIKNA
tara:strand:+ start:128 stop:1024 length:897 start_codon:yes stop_codon:yes gene_type:complete